MENELLPLHAVLAWAYSRDEEFMGVMNVPIPEETRIVLSKSTEEYGVTSTMVVTPLEEGTWPLDVAFANFCENRKKVLTPVINSIGGAWHIIRYRIYKENLKILGLPHRRAKTGSTAPAALLPPHMSKEAEPQREFWLQETMHPVSVEPLLEVELGPKFGLISSSPHLRWWREVKIESRVLNFFRPLLAADVPLQSGPSLTAADRMIREAVRALWPNGQIVERTSHRNERIMKWVKGLKSETGGSYSVSTSSIRRYFEKCPLG